MIPVDTARALTQQRHRELVRDAERCRVIAAPAYEPSAT
jgi:hypothetical protein